MMEHETWISYPIHNVHIKWEKWRDKHSFCISKLECQKEQKRVEYSCMVTKKLFHPIKNENSLQS